jgi:membrane protein
LEDPVRAKTVLKGAGLVWPWVVLAGVAGLIARDQLKGRTPATEASTAPFRDRTGRADRGRAADAPAEIPRRGWKDIFWRTAREVQADDILGVARSIAYSGLLALFPALAAFVSIYGLFADVVTARIHLAGLTGVVPADALTMLGDEMVRIAAANDAGLSFTAVTGLLISVWSANAGMTALFKGLNVAFEETEKRNLIRRTLITLTFTVGMLAFLVVSAGAVIAAPAVLRFFHASGVAPILAWLRWPALLAVSTFGLSLLYRYGPSRERARWRWVSVGALFAAVLWLAASVLFSWYLSNFAHYQATYGSLGAVFGFMVWLWLSSVVILVGAELNAEIEHQTARDSTTGTPEPLGDRGAAMADEIGRPAPTRLTPKSVLRFMRRRDPEVEKLQQAQEKAAG